MNYVIKTFSVIKTRRYNIMEEVKSSSVSPDSEDEDLMDCAEDLYNQGDYGGSLMLYDSALDQLKEKNGESQIQEAKIYQSIAKVYEAMVNYEQAEDYLLKSLVINIDYYGEKHMRVIKVYLKIIDILFKQGKSKFEKAMQFCKDLVRAVPTDLDDELLDIAEYYESIGDLLFKLNEPSNALDLYKKSMEIYIKHTEANRLALPKIYFKIGNVYLSENDWTNSLDFLMKSMDQYGKHLDLDRLDDVCNLFLDSALTCNNSKKYSEAIIILKQLLIMYKFPEMISPKVGEINGMIGDIMILMKDYNQAFRHHKLCLNVYTKLFGGTDLLVLKTIARLNLISYKVGGMEHQSKTYFQKMYVLGKKLFGANDEKCIDAKNAISVLERNTAALQDHLFIE